jgi:AraC family transcriptional regulator
MEWLNTFNSLIEYIEEHLDSEIDIDEIEKITACPYRIFQRMFSYIVGIPLTEYIRRRRLTEAAYELQTCDSKVIDIAIKFGYESADAFCVAFKKLHGITPAMARQQNIKVKSYPKLSFTMAIRGGEAMNYRLVEKEEIKVIGIFGSIQDDIWGKVKKDGSLYELEKIGGGDISLGICFGYDENGINTYMVAVEAEKEEADKYATYTIQASSWIVFESKGPIYPTLSDTWKRIYGEFMPSSNYEQNPDIPTIEKYFSNDTMAEGYYVEIWIPIIKK